nr:DDE-type integrase/transposase/recombinase [Paenibacillus sp. RC67]
MEELDQAYRHQRPKGSVLHHSDRGSQYVSHEYQARLKTYSMAGSMSRKGNCYDNACIESFHSVLKKELIYLENTLLSLRIGHVRGQLQPSKHFRHRPICVAKLL